MTNTPTQGVSLSICIATLNRADTIGETLDSILVQVCEGVEIVVVDGASKDHTEQVMLEYARLNPAIRYFREAQNSGIDADFDKAVEYSCGEYCWLMTDDDLLIPGAIDKVLGELKGSRPNLLVVDAEVRNVDFSRVLQRSRMFLSEDMVFDEVSDHFLEVAGDQLSFIAATIMRRECWLARNRTAFYGSLFVHVGVIMQQPKLRNVVVLAAPQIQIRYGNAMWTARSFEIWMFMWPRLIWGFEGFSPQAKAKVCRREPWKRVTELLKHRGKGSFGLAEYQKFLVPAAGKLTRVSAFLVTLLPASWANFFAVAYVIIFSRNSRLGLTDLLDSPHAGRLCHGLAKAFPLADITE